MVARGRDEMGEEAGGPEARCRAQGWHIVEGSSQEKGHAEWIQEGSLGTAYSLQKPSPSLRNLGTEGQRGHRKTDKTQYWEAGSNRKLNYYVQLVLEKKIKSHFLKTKFWG